MPSKKCPEADILAEVAEILGVADGQSITEVAEIHRLRSDILSEVLVLTEGPARLEVDLQIAFSSENLNKLFNTHAQGFLELYIPLEGSL